MTELKPRSIARNARSISSAWSRCTATGAVDERAIARVAVAMGSRAPWERTQFSEICRMTGSPVASAAAVSPSAVSRWSTLNAATAVLWAWAARRSSAVLARLMAGPRGGGGVVEGVMGVRGVGWVSGRWSGCRESRRACRDRVKGVVRQTRGRAEHEILCEHGCAEQASVIGKGSQKQRWATVEAEQPIKLLREWREQRVTGSCEPAAEHDRVGCDNGNE